MRHFAPSWTEALRGAVALGLIALGVGVVAPMSPLTAGVMAVAAVFLAASGKNAPVMRLKR